MKVKVLRAILEGLDPEASVVMEVGRDEEYRVACAKAELVNGDCLYVLDVDRVEIDPDDCFTNIVLKQINITYLDELEEKFDKLYKKTEP